MVLNPHRYFLKLKIDFIVAKTPRTVPSHFRYSKRTLIALYIRSSPRFRRDLRKSQVHCKENFLNSKYLMIFYDDAILEYLSTYVSFQKILLFYIEYQVP